MVWKMILLPLLSLVMVVVNVVQLAARLSQPEPGSLAGSVLMTIVWLGLLVFSLRYALSRGKGSVPPTSEKKDNGPQSGSEGE